MSSVANKADRAHRISLEAVRPEMAKADLKPVENRDFRAEIGHAIERAASLAGISKKELAGLVGCEPAQLSRWIAGTETPQFARLFAVAVMREPLCVALAQMSGAEIHMDIKFRRLA